MLGVKTNGIEVPSTSTPDLATSRRHFVSGATVLGAVLAAVISSPTRVLAQGKGHGNGNANGTGNGHGNGGGGVHCFLKGTQILSPQGERSIDDLQIGDLILTVRGESKPIKWIGRMRFERDGPTPADKDVAPVRVARGAFNGDLPHSDLYVSYGHRFLINGILIPAGDLLNGSSITRWKPTNWSVVEYLHIELESHDVILANGAPAETLEGNASRIEFDNFDEYVALYGAALTHQTPYAPVVARHGRRQIMRSHLRGMLAPICDRRQPVEIIWDELARQAHRRPAA
jgi:Hint domain-containing protein